jgi:hypothetical protein
VCTVHQQCQSLYYPANALNYINRSFVKTSKCLKYFKKNCSNIFRITKDPSSGSYIQYLTKITDEWFNRASFVTCVAGVMAAYSDL